MENKIIQNLSVDCAIFGFDNLTLKLLLIKLDVEPEKGKWALPGGNILQDEDTDTAATRVLVELSGVKNVFLDQLAAFSNIKRFPLFRVITIAYYALVKPEKYVLNPGPKASDAKWFPIAELPDLPFDHNEIVEAALKRLKINIWTKPIGFELLPKKFTLTQLQTVYECILDHTLDKRNFRKKITSLGYLIPLDEKQIGVPHRAPRLFKFDKKKYELLKQQGFQLDF